MARTQEAQEAATQQRREERAQAFVAPEEPAPKRAATAAASGPTDLAELTAKFKKQGEERKRRLTATGDAHGADAYLERPRASSKRRAEEPA